MYEGMIAETVVIQGDNGDQIDAYFARPTGPGPHPGVVVIHHMPGWDQDIKEIVRKIAAQGYAAICPNLHHRNGPGTAAEMSAATREAGGVPDAQFIGDTKGTVQYLLAQPYLNGKVGVIGFCSGGRQVVVAACNIPEFNAAVDCWGRPDGERACCAAGHDGQLRVPITGFVRQRRSAAQPGAGRPPRGRTKEAQQDV